MTRQCFLSGKFADPFKAATVGVRSEHIENLGSDSYVYVDIGSTEPVIVPITRAMP